MIESRYPELERRREMLRLVHAWTQAQPDANAPLSYNELIELVDVGPDDPKNYEPQEVYRKAADHANRLMRLVDEGHINGRYDSGPKGGPPFNFVWIKGLSETGLQVIEELADPRAELLARLDNISEAIRTLSDEDAPPEQKRLAERALGELKHFLRGLPPGVATEVGFRALGG